MTTLHLRKSIGRSPLRLGLPRVQATSIIRGFLLIPLLLACPGLAPVAQAVGPDTEGAILGSNNGEGVGVLVSRTTGVWNTGTGFEALNHLTAGNQNMATGLRALSNNTNGGFNTATGVFSLFSNTSGFFNTATGAYSLANNISGNHNTANGYAALYRNSADDNTATGFAALYHNTAGAQNTATGLYALLSNIGGGSNTANGLQALQNNTTGGVNTANGFGALYSNTTGDYNTANGWEALSHSTGSPNTALGAEAGIGVNTAYDVICIGALVSGEDVNYTTWIGNIYGVTTVSASTLPVIVSQTDQLGTMSSSRRFKKEIKAMDRTSEAILGLKPVTFQYKSDPAAAGPQFGLIAEEVAEVNPDLVVRDADGEIYTVRYDAVNAMLLNEFLKEHRAFLKQQQKVDDQEPAIAHLKSTLAKQQKGIEVFAARLKEQDSKIAKVSAQIEARNPAPQIVLHNQ